MADPKLAELKLDGSIQGSDTVRELHITYDLVTQRIDVKGHVLDKLTCFQMLLEAGHIIIGIPVPAPGKPN